MANIEEETVVDNETFQPLESEEEFNRELTETQVSHGPCSHRQPDKIGKRGWNWVIKNTEALIEKLKQLQPKIKTNKPSKRNIRAVRRAGKQITMPPGILTNSGLHKSTGKTHLPRWLNWY